MIVGRPATIEPLAFATCPLANASSFFQNSPVGLMTGDNIASLSL